MMRLYGLYEKRQVGRKVIYERFLAKAAYPKTEALRVFRPLIISGSIQRMCLEVRPVK